MEYSEEFLKKIVQVGILAYPFEKIINVFDIENIEVFKNDFFNKESIIYKNYKKGIDKADFAIDLKLYNMAKDGDLKALEKFEKRKRLNEIELKKERTEFNFKALPQKTLR